MRTSEALKVLDEVLKLRNDELLTILNMVDYCLNMEVGLGMDGGYHLDTMEPTNERLRLQALVALSKITD